MKSLPYIVPDDDAFLNAGLLLLIISCLSKTNRGKLLLNNEKVLIFMYLIKNPSLLVEVLQRLGRPAPRLTHEELYSVSSISVNLDPLFDHDWLKGLLMHVSSLGFLRADYRKGDGFMYSITDEAVAAVDNLTGDYFARVREYITHLDSIKGESVSSLNALLNTVFKR